MKNDLFGVRRIGVALIFSIGFVGAGWSQPCVDTKELLLLPGKHVEHKMNPIGGFVSDFSVAEKATALKVLNNIKAIALKNFKLSGGQAQSNFHFQEKYYFGPYYHSSYQYRLSFYQFMCVNGKQLTSDEYGNDLQITVNPSLPYFFTPPTNDYETGFYMNGESSSGPLIDIFRYITFIDNVSIDDRIASGTFSEQYQGGSDAYDKQGDVHRTWYLAQKGKRVLEPVSRKEYLNSLLVFYDREVLKLGKKHQRLLNESKEYMAKYEKNGNKAMYQSHLENKQKAEKELENIQMRKAAKAGLVQKLLQSQTEEWLRQPAKIDPAIRNHSYCDNADDFRTSGYFTFRSFCELPKGLFIYKWSPDYFKQQSSTPAEPLLISVRLRYKKDNAFSEGILKMYMSGLELSVLQKIVEQK